MRPRRKANLYSYLLLEMFSKMNVKKYFVLCLCFTWCFVLCGNLPVIAVGKQTVDGIVAIVNDEIIILSDLRIVTSFAIYADDIKGQEENASRIILEKLIDQKLITQMTKENISIEDADVEQVFQVIKNRVGEDRLNRQFERFDLTPVDLFDYIRAKLFYDQIIALKFKREARVTLKEMEAYYNEIYLPFKAGQGEEPKSMMEILDEIESVIKEEKTQKQVKDWIMNMRRQAGIQIYDERILQ